MKASGIIAGGVVGSLLLLGIALAIHPGEASRAAAGDAPAREARPTASRVERVSPGDSPLAARARGDASPGSGPEVSSAGGSLPEPGTTASPSGGTEAPQAAVDADAARRAEMLAVAQRAPSAAERADAVHWLGRNGTPTEFDALLTLQMEDPDPEVRRAAEASANALRSRHAHQPWPGVHPPADPFGYMDEEPGSRP